MCWYIVITSSSDSFKKFHCVYYTHQQPEYFEYTIRTGTTTRLMHMGEWRGGVKENREV